MSDTSNSEVKMEEDGLFIRYTFTVDDGQEPLRVDKYLVNKIERASRNKLQEAIDQKHVIVDGKAVKANYKVKPKNFIEVLVDKEPSELEVIPQDIPLDIVFEDDDLMIVNKKAGMVVHPGFGNESGTLLNALAYVLDTKATHQGKRPWLVHRIDKNTSGLLVVAKNDESMAHLSQQFKDHSIERTYQALVWGSLKELEGTLSTIIGRDKYDRKKFVVLSEDEDRGKHAITHFKVLEDFLYTSLVECKLETGRTHQIRVHMKHMGHPLFSDDHYGGNRILKGVVFSKYKQFVDNCFSILPRQGLHAKSLGFQHPTTKKWMQFDSELPHDMQTVVDKWRNASITYGF
ncbi:MAG: RluA family pseudouridine synthase [Bacteroidia bacterium]|jgi:23S rRNA pseudouridine1911/1915/1917 synthase|nr:RluA family pseudouridine synthase [Bacteroidia bacterium]MDG2042270.1 RluA family pseudouridine synthase [Bacteroidia bacterium]|tara:strand:+ start:4526 stop:5563 length:1038 start_codon:yes stop_codon:yes gene_type:complete